MPTLVKPKKTRKPATFTITFRIGADEYGVVPLRDVHPDVAQLAVRLCKHTGGKEVYDVRLDPAGHVHCDCQGFERWQTPCKHIRSCVAAGMLPRSILQPASNSNVPCEF